MNGIISTEVILIRMHGLNKCEIIKSPIQPENRSKTSSIGKDTGFTVNLGDAQPILQPCKTAW